MTTPSMSASGGSTSVAKRAASMPSMRDSAASRSPNGGALEQRRHACRHRRGGVDQRVGRASARMPAAGSHSGSLHAAPSTLLAHVSAMVWPSPWPRVRTRTGGGLLGQLDRRVARVHRHPPAQGRQQAVDEALLVAVGHADGAHGQQPAQAVVHRGGQRRQLEALRPPVVGGRGSHQAMPWAGAPIRREASSGTSSSSMTTWGWRRSPDSSRVTSSVTSASEACSVTAGPAVPVWSSGNRRSRASRRRSQRRRLLISSSRTTSSLRR